MAGYGWWMHTVSCDWVIPSKRDNRKRVRKDRARRKAVRRQKRHLRAIKSDAELRAIVLGSRHKP